MALPQGFVIEQAQEEAPMGGLPAGFQLEQAPEKQQQVSPSMLSRLGRGAASALDVTLGGILPAAVQMGAYPLARLGRSPEEAQAATARLVSKVDQPFGKAFGVEKTPEYQGEAGRQLLDFVGANFQKGAKWIADKTGLPASDVENMMGTLSVAAPAVAGPVSQATKKVVKPFAEQAVVGAKLPFEKTLQARREAASLNDYERGPQIEAATEAQRLGIALRPDELQQTAGPKILSAMAGSKGTEAITKANINQVRKVGLEDMGLPLNTQLNGLDAFNQARNKVAAPYNEIKKLPTMALDETTQASLNKLRPDESLIGSDKYASAINALIDDAETKMSAGLTGAELLKNVQILRKRAKKVYNNKSADLASLDFADTNLAIANTLESMLESNISNPKLLNDFRDARQKMARTYAYEGATDFNTGIIDVTKLGRITAKDNTLTGDISSLGKIAGNFPDAFNPKPRTRGDVAVSIGRSGAAGSLGGLAGYALGGDYTSAAIGSLFGAGLGEMGQSMAARTIASPGYQAGLKISDFRIPVSQVAAAARPVEPNTTTNSLVPYQAPVEVLMPGQGTQFQNFTMQGQPTFGAAPTPYAQRSLTNEVPKQVYQAQKNAELAQEFRAAAERRPTGTGSVLDFDPITGTYKVGGAGIKGATPEVFQADTGASLKTATTKVAEGRLFDMTAAEKVAWDKTKVDLQELSPALKALSSKEIAAKMADRKWVQDTINKANEQIKGYAEIEKRAANMKALNDARIKREKLEDTVQQLQDTLQARPSSRNYEQGPVTRAFQRGLFQGNQ